jgi:hypothetical protein
VGGNPKDHLACKRSFQVRVPGQTLKARYFRTALVAKEKSHLVLGETTSLPEGPEIAHYPGYHRSSGRPGYAEPLSQFRQRWLTQKKSKVANLASFVLKQCYAIVNESFMNHLHLKVEVGDIGEVFKDPLFFPVTFG